MLYYFLSNESSIGSVVAQWAKQVKERVDDYSLGYELREKLRNTEADQDMGLFVASCFDFQEITRAHFRGDIRNKMGRQALEVATIYGSCIIISEII